MANATPQSASSLLQYLPAIYQDDPFLGQFLLAFEKILLGRDDGIRIPPTENPLPDLGLEERIASVAEYFDPAKAPEDFLPWLASWTAFSLRADLDVDKQRKFIANIAQLYRWRGTKRNLQDLLKIFTVSTPAVVEGEADGIQIGQHSTIGKDMQLGGEKPFYFQVKVSLPRAAPAVQERQLRIAHALVELEKPAHTVYELLPFFPSMRIGQYSKVGVDTLLGTAQED